MRRAIGIVRVSSVAGREGDSFASPTEQADRIRQACRRDRLELLEIVEELDVSGGTPLDRRHGLRAAVEAIEAGDAEIVVAAYFDRLVRSLRVQDELVSRVEHAGGRVLAVDIGQVTGGSAGQWLSGTMLGAVSEYQRRTTAERTAEAQARAVARGVAPYPNVPPGYQRQADGRLEPDPATAGVVAEAFRLRAEGATIRQVRAHLKANGVERTYHGTQSLLRSRVVLGEIHFGALSNLRAHQPIVDPDTWRAVQRIRTQRGRRPTSPLLLARLGVLRCATCGTPMNAGSAGRYPLYRCPPTGDCPNRAAISAHIADRAVTEAAKGALDGEGRASLAQAAREAEQELDVAQRNLDAAIRAFAALDDEPAAHERLADLAGARNEAREQVDRLRGTGSLTVTVGDWDSFTREEQRALIVAVVDRATVTPGRGERRVKVTLRE